MRTTLAVSALLIAGCAGIGYVATTDPYQKLGQAQSLVGEDRLLAAEDVIGQALSTFQQRNDIAGMAEAYHAYGNLYKNGLFQDGRWTPKFQELGTWDGTYTKSIANFSKAQQLFEQSADEIGAVKCLVGAGNAYSLRNDKPKACALYREALTRYRNAKGTGQPLKAHPILTGYADIGALTEAFIAKERCGT